MVLLLVDSLVAVMVDEMVENLAEKMVGLKGVLRADQ